ncbi:MAG: transglutaminase domain-containing protein, partial [Ilumatobacteraceae bacterium]
VGVVAAGLAVGASLSALAACARRWNLLPLVPLALTYLAVIALSAPLGVQPWTLIIVCILAVTFAALHDEGRGLHDRWLFLRGERRLFVLVALAALIAGLVSVPVTFAARADPRQDEQPTDTAALLDPIQATVALRSLDPPQLLHEITRTGGSMAADAPMPTRWRTAALDEYDGRRWNPTLTIRPIGRTLGTASGPTIGADVSFLRDYLTLVPLPGSPVSVDAEVETDPDRTIVRLVERPVPGDVVGIVSNVGPESTSVAAADVAVREIDENVAALTGLAESLAATGDNTVFGQLRAIEATMANSFVLQSDAPGGGLQRILIDRFLRDTRRGNTEQFVTAFVLLARSLGVDARVASGFIVAPPPDADRLEIASSDAVIWPEVMLTDGTWVAFDPVPEAEAAEATPPVPEPEVQTPAAPQPPDAVPPDVDNESPDADTDPTDTSSTNLSEAAVWGIRIGVGVGVLVVPLLLGAGAILGAKYHRRRRRRKADEASERIRGAWASATDDLVDAGLLIPQSSTDVEIATCAEVLAPGARRELHRLAALNGAATFGMPTRADLLAQDAAACLTSIDGAIVNERSRWQRLRWRLSVRSLRSTTRSPVAV